MDISQLTIKVAEQTETAEDTQEVLTAIENGLEAGTWEPDDLLWMSDAQLEIFFGARAGRVLMAIIR